MGGLRTEGNRQEWRPDAYGANKAVLFYKSFGASYRYTPLGHVKDPAGLASAVGVWSVIGHFLVEKPFMKTVLITGANRGIGFETARQLAARGFHVVIGARSEQHGRKAVRELESLGKVSLLVLDVSDSGSIASAASEFSPIGHLDVLINNAGIYPDEGISILKIQREQIANTFQTNTFGALEVTQVFLPYLRKSAAARVINVSSGYGQIDGLSANAPSYCLSKLTMNGLTIMLAEALREHGIAVNSMCPGWVRTEMGGSTAPRSVEEGADTAVWLAKEADQKLTGKFFRDRKEIDW